jgi:hypothetical protein
VDDLRYYRRRLLQEEKAVNEATCPAARDRHEELAAAYQLRSRLILAVVTTGKPAQPEAKVDRGGSVRATTDAI